MKIFLTYDFLTTQSYAGKKYFENLSFLQKVLEALTLEVKVDNSLSSVFNLKKFTTLLDQSYNDMKYINWNVEKVNPSALAMINEYIDGADILITYELSMQTRQLFDSHNIKYIDIWMSPIRFDKDIMFMFYSNIDSVQKKIKVYEVDNKKFHLAAKSISDQFKYFIDDALELQQNSILLVGQMFYDKAVMKDGKFLNLLDFKERILELSKQYSKIYFQKHPLMHDDEFQIYLSEFQDINNLVYLEGVNIYNLLSREEIVKVVAISSSVLEEARYFKKDVEYFYQPAVDENYINIFKDWYKTSFWNDVLGLNNQKLDVEYLNYDDFLRYELYAFYGYDIFMAGKKRSIVKSKYNAIVDFYSILQTLDRTKPYILYGYGSVGKLIAPHFENVVGVIDQNIPMDIQDIEGYKVIQIKQLNEYKDAIILVTPFIHKDAIKQNLESYENKVIFLG